MWRRASASRSLLFRALTGPRAVNLTRPVKEGYRIRSPWPPRAFSSSRQTLPGGSHEQQVGTAEEDGVSFSEAKRLMRLANVESLKRKLEREGEEVIGYSEFLRECEGMGVAKSQEEAAGFAGVLDQAGVILLFRDKVYLHPSKVVDLMRKAVPLALMPENDPRREELKELKKKKENINILAHRLLSLSSARGACQFTAKKELRIGTRCFSTSDVPSYVVLGMPALSPTMNQGNIIKWRKKEGDKVNTGDVLCEIETDKAVLEFESLEEGFLAKILAPEGSKDVPVGQPIAITVEDIEALKDVPTTLFGGPEKEKTSSKVIEENLSVKEVEHKESSQKAKFNRVSPAAKLLIIEFGLDISSLKASGPRGTLLKSDILEVIKSGRIPTKSSGLSQEKPTEFRQHSAPSSPPLPNSSSSLMGALQFDDLPNSQIRKVIARRLVESKQSTPHLYLSSDVMLDPLLAFRNILKEQHNVKVSINDIIIKAVAISLRSVPEANAFWNDKEGKASLCDNVDISIAVATEKGLMTPIVRDADQKSLSAISLEVKELAEKARAGKLSPDQYQGGTFSISNLGMFPVDRFCAIINPPQSCILAVGQGNKVVEPVVGDDGVEKPIMLTKMCMNLSADNRVYDNEIGGKFLSALSANLANVQRLLL